MSTSGAGTESARAHVSELLRTMGVRDSTELALGKTITPGTFARQSASALPQTLASSGADAPSVGPLPRIAVASPRASAPDGEVAADFELVGLLGEGGMGRVHLARQRSLGRDVAIKSLKEEAQSVRSAEMLRSEATVMGRLEHPNVVPVHAVGMNEAGGLVLVMKRIDGVSWSELLKNDAHPRWEALLEGTRKKLDVHLDVLGAVARALEFAHQRGIIHRDVKPDNVLVGLHGDVYLADWGVALRLADGKTENELVGTPAYMAREMVEGDPKRQDARTDVHLLGACLHEVLTGAPPHAGRNLHQILIAAYDAEPKVYPAEVSQELAAIATKAMAPSREDRYASALLFRRALDDVRQHRVSIALAKEGERILAHVATLAPGGSEVDRALTEARFAFVQALRDWPENAEARAGLSACLRRSIEHELGRENAGAAHALYAELGEQDPLLGGRIEALDRTLEARRAENERLKRLEADQDLSVGRRARNVAVAFLVVLLAGISLVVMVQTGGSGRAVSGRELVGISTFILAACLVTVLMLRKRLLANAINRKIAGLAVVSCAVLVVHRLIALAWAVPPDSVLAMDLALMAAIPAAGAAIVPRLMWATPIGLVGALVAWLDPESIATVFSVTGVATMGALAFLIRGAAEEPKERAARS